MLNVIVFISLQRIFSTSLKSETVKCTKQTKSHTKKQAHVVRMTSKIDSEGVVSTQLESTKAGEPVEPDNVNGIRDADISKEHGENLEDYTIVYEDYEVVS